MKTLDPAPRQLVKHGRFETGAYREALPRINPLDAALGGRLPWPRPLKWMRLKEWQAFQLSNGRWFLNVALFNAKTLALAQIKLYDRVNQRKVLFERKLPPWSFSNPDNLLDSECAYRGRGCEIRFRNRLSEGEIDIHLDVERAGKLPAIRGALTVRAAGWSPLVVCIPFDEARAMYSHKGMMPVEGALDIGEERAVFDLDESFALMDDHKGFYPWEMIWDWVTAGGRDVAGRRVGFNLTANQSMDPERFNENAVWIGGAIHRLPPVRFERHGDRWRVEDREGRVELDFQVQVPGRVDINALIIRSKYSGPFGHFNGVLRPESLDDDEVRVEDMFGMGEDFYLRC